jgi:D-arabinose 1-dehydrogenase-like Zn-dependent alcohol dehydrogenase
MWYYRRWHKRGLDWLVGYAGRRFVGGSLIGGAAETQEMLDFCGKNNISCMIEKIPMSYVNTAMERLVKNDVKYRFVIDIEKTLIE